MASTDFVDVVNDKDEVIGKSTIAEVQEKGLIHRIVRIMVESTDGRRILLQKRVANKSTWPNCWDNSAAGHVDSGESYLTAAKRELHEEIGISVEDIELVGAYFTDKNYQDKLMKRNNMVYSLKTDSTPQDLEESEVSEVKWFTLEEIKELISGHPDQVTDGLIDVIARYYP